MPLRDHKSLGETKDMIAACVSLAAARITSGHAGESQTSQSQMNVLTSSSLSLCLCLSSVSQSASHIALTQSAVCVMSGS